MTRDRGFDTAADGTTSCPGPMCDISLTQCFACALGAGLESLAWLHFRSGKRADPGSRLVSGCLACLHAAPRSFAWSWIAATSGRRRGAGTGCNGSASGLRAHRRKPSF